MSEAEVRALSSLDIKVIGQTAASLLMSALEERLQLLRAHASAVAAAAAPASAGDAHAHTHKLSLSLARACLSLPPSLPPSLILSLSLSLSLCDGALNACLRLPAAVRAGSRRWKAAGRGWRCVAAVNTDTDIASHTRAHARGPLSCSCPHRTRVCNERMNAC